MDICIYPHYPIYTHTYVYMYIYMYIHCIIEYIYIYTHTHTYIHTHNSHTHTHTLSHTYTHIYMYVYMYILTHIHVCIYVYTHTHITARPGEEDGSDKGGESSDKRGHRRHGSALRNSNSRHTHGEERQLPRRASRALQERIFKSSRSTLYSVSLF